MSFTSLFVGHMSLKKTSLPFLSLEIGSDVISIFIDPAIAYAITKGGDAK